VVGGKSESTFVPVEKQAMAARSRADSGTKPRSDIYTGLLVLAFLAQIAGFTFLLIDYMSYAPGKPPAVPGLVPPKPQTPAPGVPGQP
jgi:hypothetical protein